MTTEAPFSTVCFIGLGLIGGSLARLIRKQLPQTQILALDTPEVLDQAMADGTINGTLTGIGDPRLLVPSLVILGTHLYQSFDVLRELASMHPHEALQVMDLGSTKQSICQLADSLGPSVAFIGGHPLAGREVSGYANSRADLFVNKRFLLTPCKTTPAAFETQVVAWLTRLNTRPTVLPAAHHDELMGLVSHFPQLYAVALANLLHRHRPEEAMQFLGGGIDDQMRLMASSYHMWRDIYQDNRAAMLPILDDFIAVMTRMREDLLADALAPWFDTSHEIYRMYLAQKAESAPTPETGADGTGTDGHRKKRQRQVQPF